MPVNLGIWSCWKDVAGKWECQDGIPSPKEKIRGYNRVNLCTGVGGQNTKQGRLSHRHNFWAGSTTEGHSLNVFQATLWFSETPLDGQLALFQMNSPTYRVEYILFAELYTFWCFTFQASYGLWNGFVGLRCWSCTAQSWNVMCAENNSDKSWCWSSYNASNYKFAFMQSERTRQRLTVLKIFLKEEI